MTAHCKLAWKTHIYICSFSRLADAGFEKIFTAWGNTFPDCYSECDISEYLISKCSAQSRKVCLHSKMSPFIRVGKKVLKTQELSNLHCLFLLKVQLWIIHNAFGLSQSNSACSFHLYFSQLQFKFWPFSLHFKFCNGCVTRQLKWWCCHSECTEGIKQSQNLVFNLSKCPKCHWHLTWKCSHMLAGTFKKGFMAT